MRNKRLILCILASGLACLTVSGRENVRLLEAESFSNPGGWVLCNQYLDQMGSPYLMAHGIGAPVEDAQSTISIPESGNWHIYVRTYNWTAPWTAAEGPGKFRIKINGTFADTVLGCTGKCWEWQYAGVVKLRKGINEVALVDLCGFDGRCDAILFSKKRLNNPDEIRESLTDKEVKGTSKFDFVVCGGGIAGMCAAVSAARLGLKTALIHDRSILGGNNSAEIRVHLGGVICCGPYPKLGNMVKEFGHTQKGNAMSAENYEDWKKTEFVEAEPNLTVFYNNHIIGVDKMGDKIVSVVAQDTHTGVRTRYEAPLFADCTGDGTVGFLAGADFRMGRESISQTGEPSAVTQADRQVMGSSVQWNTAKTDNNPFFPEFNYGISFDDENCYPLCKGDWTWETGMKRDQIEEAERIRDYGLLVVYSNWSWLKNHYVHKEQFADRCLNWVAYIAGKRESRRLLGDYILNENDILEGTNYPDASVAATWSIDLHYPDPTNAKNFPDDPFVSICKQDHINIYAIPYRCFYSRNVDNLFMAGRNISVTHVGLGTVRVMRTTGMMGEVVGMAASICHNHSSLPRSVYTDWLNELTDLMKEGCGKKDLPDNQKFNTGRSGVLK